MNVKTKKAASKKRTGVRPKRDRRKNVTSPKTDDYDFQPIIGNDGRLVGLITDPDICDTAVRNNLLFQLNTNTTVNSNEVVTDEDLQSALHELLELELPRVYVDVAGGIVRHGIR